MTKPNRLFDGSGLYEESECRINRDNIKYMTILSMIMLLCDVLNEIGIFHVAPFVMRVGTSLGVIIFLVPSIVLLRTLNPFRKCGKKLVFASWHKYFILAFAWLGTAAAAVTLTHHTIFLMALPIMIMSQYRNTVMLVHITVVLGTVCVLLGVYGGYFFGCFDGNLLHLKLSDSNVADLDLRVRIATSERMLDLLTHYALPREIIVIALTLLASKMSKRSDEMLRRQAELQSIAENEMQRTNEIQRRIIDGMANLIENRDSSTGEHVKRTSFYVKRIVDKLQAESAYSGDLSDTEATTIVRAAPLHDIGKISVSDRILLKPGKLTAAEFEEIKHHAQSGADVIKNVLGNIEDDSFLRTASEIAGRHHERWDGKGYPIGLSGKNIPLSARIMAVADVFDALVSKRIYKEPIPPEKAFLLIESEAGKQFDPEVVRVFLEIKPEILAYLNQSLQVSAI